MGVVEATIENVLSNLDTPPTYLRASKLEEANVELSQIDTSSAVAIYYNLPIIVAEMVHGRPIEIHPVKISFVKKAALDSTGVADDTVRDAMETLAHEFYDSLVLNWTDTFEKFDGYTMDPVSMDKPFDEKMVGFSLEFDIKLMRGVSAKIIADTTIQVKWDALASSPRNTFVDNNTFAIITHIYDSANATAVIARMTNPVIAEEAAMSKFVTLNGANWDLIDDFHSYAVPTEVNALTGWKLKALTNVNNSTHTPGTGFAFNGTTQYINSNFVPSTDGIKLVQDDALVGAFAVSGVFDNANFLFGAENNFNSKVNLSVGYYDGSWSITIPQTITSGVNYIYTISDTSTNLTLNYTFIAGNDTTSFYSTLIFGDITVETWNVAVEDTCTCAGLNNNWEVDLSDYCVLSATCDLGTGKLSFINSGNFTCNAQLDTTNLGDVGSGNYLWINSGCRIYIT